MKTKLLATSLLVSCALYSFAQAQENETKLLNHDIGFNTTFILQGVFDSNSTPFFLMYKKYSDEKKALRLGMSAIFDMRDNNDKATYNNVDNTTYYNVSVSVGKEFQKHITQKWTWYSGGDIVPSYYFSGIDTYQGTTKLSTNKNSSIGLGLRPFLGIRFNVNSRLYLSAEASLLARYSYNRDYTKQEDNNVVTRDSKGSRICMNLSPASGLYLFYRF